MKAVHGRLMQLTAAMATISARPDDCRARCHLLADLPGRMHLGELAREQPSRRDRDLS